MPHTPRPWTVYKTEASVLIYSGDPADEHGRTLIASMEYGSPEDAALIEAAPELLAFIKACGDCRSANELHDFYVNNADVVIARAEGKK